MPPFSEHTNDSHGFRIVHNDRACMYDHTSLLLKDRRMVRDTHPGYFLGAEGLAYLLQTIIGKRRLAHVLGLYSFVRQASSSNVMIGLSAARTKAASDRMRGIRHNAPLAIYLRYWIHQMV